MAIAREEIFGPVLGVMTCNSPEEALSIAADTEFGLHASVFTRNIDRALSIARRLPGRHGVGQQVHRRRHQDAVRRLRKSGSLARDNGVEAIDQYLQTKTIWIDITPAV